MATEKKKPSYWQLQQEKRNPFRYRRPCHTDNLEPSD